MSEVVKKKGMNLPNKITCARLVLAVIVLIVMCLNSVGVFNIKEYTILNVAVNPIYLVCGVLFAIGSITDFLDGYLARSRNLVTDFGKVTDAVADKVLVNGVLILLAYDHFLPVVVPVIIITRDIAVDCIKMTAGNKGKVVAASWPGKIKTICMMIGVTLTFFYDMPFAFIGAGTYVSDGLVYLATILSIYSGVKYFLAYKDFIFKEM